MATTATGDLLDSIQFQTGPDPRWAVIWLHGLGADGNDFAPMVPQLVPPGWPAIRFVFPHAPVRAVTINGGMRMRAWYDIQPADFDPQHFGDRADAAGIEESVAQVEALIAREAARGIPPPRLLLAGFSQGGAVALAAALRRVEPLAGVIALSSYLPASNRAGVGLADTAREQPVFMAHGAHDNVVPYAAGEQAARRLRELGLTVDWHRYPIAHQVSPEEIRDLAGWMTRRFAHDVADTPS